MSKVLTTCVLIFTPFSYMCETPGTPIHSTPPFGVGCPPVECSESPKGNLHGDLAPEPLHDSLDDQFADLSLDEQDRLCRGVNFTCPNAPRPQSGPNSTWSQSDNLAPNFRQQCPHTLGGVVAHQWDPSVPQGSRYCLPTTTSKHFHLV